MNLIFSSKKTVFSLLTVSVILLAVAIGSSSIIQVILIGAGIAIILFVSLLLLLSNSKNYKENEIINPKNNFEGVIESMADGLLVNDIEGNIINVNSNLCSVLNYTKEELLTMTLYEINEESFKDFIKDKIKEVLLSGNINYESKYVPKNGAIIPVECHSKTILYENKQVIITFVRDISDQKRSEAAIKASERSLNSLISNLPGFIYRCANDEKWTMEYLSNGIFNLTGFSVDEFLGNNKLPYSSIIHQDDQLMVDELIQKAIETKESFELEYRIITKEGHSKYVWERGKGVFSNNGRLLYLEGFITDVTDRKLAIEAMMESEHRYYSLFDSMEEGVVLHELVYDDKNKAIDYIIKDSNKAFEHHTGLNILKGINKKATEFYGVADAPYLDIYSQVAETGISNQFETYFAPLNKHFNISVFSPKKGFFATVFSDISQSKESEAAIFAEKERLSVTLNSIGDAVIATDTESKITFMNPVAENLTGWSINDAKGKLLTEVFNIINQQSGEQCTNPVETVLKYGNVVGLANHTVLISKDASEYVIADSASPIKDSEGRILGVVLVFRDDTEKHRAANALRDSEERLRLIENSSLDIIYSYDLGSRFTHANKRFCESMGLSEEQIIGKTHEELGFPTTQCEEWAELHKQVYDTNSHISKETGTLMPDGLLHYFVVNLNPLHNEDGKIIGIAGTTRDITERKSAEAKIRELNNMFEAFMENSPVYIFFKDSEMRPTYLSRNFEQMVGMPIEDIIGKNMFELFPSDLAKGIVEDDKRILNEGKLIEVEEELNGRHYSTIKFPIFIDDKPTMLAGFTIDITESKLAAEILIKAKIKAEESEKLKSSFLANMSHELRTPMNGILGFSGLISDATDLETSKRMGQIILSSGKRLMETLNLILDLSRIESGELQLDNSNFDLVEQTQKTLSIFTTNAENKNLYLKLDNKIEKLPLNSSSKAVDSILNNLINNAIKFTSIGGITIELDKQLINNREMAIIRVIDTGVGIPEDEFENIFKEFRQASEGLGRSHEGTGLGLTLTKKYVNLIGGDLQVASKINVGTTFTVLLPIEFQIGSKIIIPSEDEFHNPNQVTIFQEKIIINKHKILIVEDDEVSALLVENILKGKHHIDVVKNAFDAINKAIYNTYSLILMDINLGKSQNGLYATAEIRKLANYAKTPIIAVTAYAMKGDKEEFITAGCTDYISKPFDKYQLLSMLNKYLNI